MILSPYPYYMHFLISVVVPADNLFKILDPSWPVSSSVRHLMGHFVEQELVDLVLQEAQALVEAEGFRALTARRLAEAVGYSPGTLYNHFANLDAIVMHVNGRTLELLDQSLARTRLSGDAQADTLALSMAYFAFIESHPRLWEQLFEYRLGEGCEIPDWFTGKIRQLLRRLETVLAPLFDPSQVEPLEEAVQVLWLVRWPVCKWAW